jgi:hypothetical protein
MTLISATLRRFGVVFVVDVPRAVLFWRVERVGVDVVFVGGVDVLFVLFVEVFVLFAFAFGVVVSFSVFFFSAAAVFETLEVSFRLVLEEVDEVLLRERVEDAFLGVTFVPLDDELVFAFLGDINHLMEY